MYCMGSPPTRPAAAGFFIYSLFKEVITMKINNYSLWSLTWQEQYYQLSFLIGFSSFFMPIQIRTTCIHDALFRQISINISTSSTCLFKCLFQCHNWTLFLQLFVNLYQPTVSFYLYYL